MPVTYWTKELGRNGDMESFHTFDEARNWYEESGEQDEAEEMIILCVKDEDDIVFAAWENNGDRWIPFNEPVGKHIDAV